MSDDKKQIGRILLKRRLISQDELDRQVAAQKSAKDGIPLASRIAGSGAVDETEVLRALSEQLGVPGIDLHQVVISAEHLDLVPREVAVASKILPVLARDGRLFLAMANPADKRVIDELEFVTGRRVYPYVAISTTLEKAIREAYDAKESGHPFYAGSAAPKDALARVEATPQRRERDSVVPGRAASVVVDQKMQDAAAVGEFSESDFGSLGEEVSRVELLPDELRLAGLSPTRPALPANSTGKTILVVDDDAEIRQMVRRLLQAKGHQVIEADRGLVALRLVKEHTPDLILLDAMLPELHGFEIARRIKGSEKYGSIPILMMSAVYRGWRIAEDLKANYGIEDYLEKPFKIAELVAKIARLLDRDASSIPHDPEQINRNAAKFLEDGIAAYRAGDTQDAIAMLQKGIAIDPLAYRLRYHLALIYGKLGQFYDGITELERAVDLNPKHFPALKNLAVLYEKAGFKNKAVEMWERCVHVSPDEDTRSTIKTHVLKLL